MHSVADAAADGFGLNYLEIRLIWAHASYCTMLALAQHGGGRPEPVFATCLRVKPQGSLASKRRKQTLKPISPFHGGNMKHIGVTCWFVMILLVVSCADSATQQEQSSAGSGAAAGEREHRADNPKPSPSRKATESHAPAQILVKFKEGTGSETIETLQKKFHLKTIRTLSRPNLYLMKIQDGLSVKETIKRLQESGAVEYAEPNYMRTVQ